MRKPEGSQDTILDIGILSRSCTALHFCFTLTLNFLVVFSNFVPRVLCGFQVCHTVRRTNVIHPNEILPDPPKSFKRAFLTTTRINDAYIPETSGDCCVHIRSPSPSSMPQPAELQTHLRRITTQVSLIPCRSGLSSPHST
jgi:hypothetical protein